MNWINDLKNDWINDLMFDEYEDILVSFSKNFVLTPVPISCANSNWLITFRIWKLHFKIISRTVTLKALSMKSRWNLY